MSNKNKTTLVLGASPNPERYANKAVKRLQSAGHNVVAIGKVPAMIGDIPIIQEKPLDVEIDTVSLYLNPIHQQDYYDYILKLKPVRIIFNPGAENDELAALAEKNGIETIEACTLVLLATDQF